MTTHSFNRIWGIGLDEEQARGLPRSKWPGLNLLGNALERVRAHFRASASPASEEQAVKSKGVGVGGRNDGSKECKGQGSGGVGEGGDSRVSRAAGMCKDKALTPLQKALEKKSKKSNTTQQSCTEKSSVRKGGWGGSVRKGGWGGSLK